jgi:hypothetical protein
MDVHQEFQVSMLLQNRIDISAARVADGPPHSAAMHRGF